MFVCVLLKLSGWLVGEACDLGSHSTSSNEQLPPVVEERTSSVLYSSAGALRNQIMVLLHQHHLFAATPGCHPVLTAAVQVNAEKAGSPWWLSVWGEGCRKQKHF